VIKTLTLLLSGVVAVACGGAALQAESPAPTAAPASTASVAPTTAPAGTATSTGALTFTVASGSEVTVAVREQLADRQAPNDAVLTTTAVRGTFTVKDDGTFADRSLIEVDLTTLESDSGLRDRYVRDTTLQAKRFPVAAFVPIRAEGLTLPLADGAFAFRLTGNMTISGVTKQVKWDVSGERTGDRITVTATNAPAWKFADFGLEIPSVLSVLSIVDEIRLTVNLKVTAG